VERDGSSSTFGRRRGSPRQGLIVLAHARPRAGKESFDLRVPGKPSYDLMDFLAREAFDVLRPGHEGLRPLDPSGRSHDDPGGERRSECRGRSRAEAPRGKAVAPRLSWGRSTAGCSSSAHPEKVEKYVSYAQMHVDSPDIAKRRPRIEAFRKNAYITIAKPAGSLASLP